jgi:prefoldin subunit 5
LKQQLREEMEKEREFEAAEAAGAGAGGVGTAVRDEAKAETDTMTTEKALGDALLRDAEGLKRIRMDAMDAAQRGMLVQTATNIRTDLNLIIDAEKKNEKMMKEKKAQIDKSISIMREAENVGSYNLQQSEFSMKELDKLTSKGLSEFKKQINVYEGHVRDLDRDAKARELLAARAQKRGENEKAQSLFAAAQEMRSTMERLRQQITSLRAKLPELQTVNDDLIKIQQSIREVHDKNLKPEFSTLKQILLEMQRMRKVGRESLQKRFDAQYKELGEAHGKLPAAEKFLDPTMPPELLISEEQLSIGMVYSSIIGLMGMSKEFYDKQAIPLLEQAERVVDASKYIENALGYVNQAIWRLQGGFLKFDSACAALIADPNTKVELDQIEKLEAAQITEDQLEIQRKGVWIDVYDKIKAKIAEDIQFIQGHINDLNTELAVVKNQQVAAGNALKSALDGIFAEKGKASASAGAKLEEAKRAVGTAASAASAAAGTAPPGT